MSGQYLWIGFKAYREWNRGERCVEVFPAIFEGVLCWRVQWQPIASESRCLVFNNEHNFESVKREIAESIFAIELREEADATSKERLAPVFEAIAKEVEE